MWNRSLARVRRLAPLAVPLLVLGLGAGPAATLASAVAAPATVRSAAAVATAQEETGPLRVTLTGLSPAVLTRTSAVTLTGTVTNTTRRTWQDVNVHAWASAGPVGDRNDLAEALDTPVEADIGQRLTTENAFVPVGDLAGGTTSSFSLTVPRGELPIPDQAGVYWIGAQALGTSPEGRDTSADGRARTFIPVLPDGTSAADAIPASLVLPVRAPVRRDVTGHLRAPATWGALLSDQGRLGRILGLAESATADQPPSLLVDPAVLDAAGVLSRGNDDAADDPIAATIAPDPAAGDTDDTNDTDDSDDSPRPAGDRGTAPATPADTAAAASWLTRAETLARRSAVLGLRYVDPDVASLAARAPGLLSQSRTLAALSFAGREIAETPTVAPTDGVLPESALDGLSGEAVLLSDSAAPDADVSAGRTAAGQPLVLADPVPSTAGPGPGDDDALVVRQRILAEAALRLQDGNRSPMVVVLPRAWDPGPAWRSSAFFSTLRVPWLRWGALPLAASREITPLTYSATARRAQVGDRLVGATRGVDQAAAVLAQTLPEDTGTVAAYRRLALQAVSYAARGSRDTSYADALALGAGIRQRLGGIRVVGSPFVTLAGGSGSFVVSVVNDLDRTVRIGLRVRTSPDLEVSVPRTVTLLPGRRTTVPVRASSDRTGVRDVVLSPTTVDGDPIGTSLDFRLRTSQVSALIWAVLGGAGVLLVAMIARRLVRRARGTT